MLLEWCNLIFAQERYWSYGGQTEAHVCDTFNRRKKNFNSLLNLYRLNGNNEKFNGLKCFASILATTLRKIFILMQSHKVNNVNIQNTHVVQNWGYTTSALSVSYFGRAAGDCTSSVWIDLYVGHWGQWRSKRQRRWVGVGCRRGWRRPRLGFRLTGVGGGGRGGRRAVAGTVVAVRAAARHARRAAASGRGRARWRVGRRPRVALEPGAQTVRCPVEYAALVKKNTKVRLHTVTYLRWLRFLYAYIPLRMTYVLSFVTRVAICGQHENL